MARTSKDRICLSKSLIVIVSTIVIVLSFLYLANYFSSSKPRLNTRASTQERSSSTTPICYNNHPCPPGWYCNGDFFVEETRGLTVEKCTQNPTSNFNLGLFPLTMNALYNNDTNTTPYILSLLFHAHPEQLINVGYFGMLPIEQQHIIEQVIDSNGIQSLINKTQKPSLIFGLSECADSRCVKPSLLWANGEYVQLLQSSNIAAQPVLFPSNTPASFFVAHVNDACSPGGCGAIGGITAILQDKSAGIEYLKHHGAPQATIDELLALIDKGVRASARDWALMGAKIQAGINNHPVVAVLNGHADDSFEVLGVVLPGGAMTSIDNYPTLKAVAAYLHQPHPINQALKAGQTPKVVALNFSKKWDTPKIYGQLYQEAGSVFKVSQSNLTKTLLTLDDIDKVAAGAGYGELALHNGKVLFITADSYADLQKVRARLALTQEANGIASFLRDKKGVIISSVLSPSNGKLGQFVMIETAETGFGAEKPLLQELSKGKLVLPEKITAYLTSIAVRIYTSLSKSGSISADDLARMTKILTAMSTGTKFVFRTIGSAADIWTLIDLSNQYNDRYFGLGPYTNNLDMSIAIVEAELRSPLSQIVSSFSFKIFRKDLINQHAKAVALYMQTGPMADKTQQRSPWKDMKSEEVGKTIRINFGERGPKGHQFLLRTGSPPDEKICGPGNLGCFNSDNPDQPIMLVSLSGAVISSISQSETYTLSYISTDSKPKQFFVWRVSTEDKDTFKFDLLGKVELQEDNQTFEEIELRWE